MDSITIRPAKNGAIVLVDQREGYANDNYQVFNKIEDMFDYLAELLDKSFPLAAEEEMEQEELGYKIDMDSFQTAKTPELGGGEIGSILLKQKGENLNFLFSIKDGIELPDIISEINKHHDLINKSFKQGDDRLDVRKI